MTYGGTTAGAARYGPMLAAVLLVAINHRPGMASIGPVLESIRADLHLSHAAAGLLTTLPLLCMGLFPVAVARLAERFGLERTVFFSLVLLAVATASRLAGMQTAVLFLSSLLIGVAVTVSQTLTPAVIKRRFERPLAVMGFYATCITVGAAVPAGLTVPLANLTGHWTTALALWALPALLAVILWWRVSSLDTPPADSPLGATPWRTGRGWLIAFLSSGAFGTFFSLLAWNAPLYQEQGWSAERAGFLLTVGLVCQITGNLLFALLAQRSADRRGWMVFTLFLLITGVLGMALAPLAAPCLWVVLAGLGGGGLFPLMMNLPLDNADNPVDVARLTAMAQSAGYFLAAPLPALIGWLRGISGGFTVPYLFLVAFGVTLVLGVMALRPRVSPSRLA
jgi:CP family cyanate transporter-like MFS transporter